jgi:hypothetical protein
MVSSVAPALTWGVLAASFVVGLAAVLRMAGPSAGADDLGGVIRLPAPLRGSVLALFALAILVFVANLVRRGVFRRRAADGPLDPTAEPRRIPPWLRALAQILSVVNLVVVAYLVWRGAIPLTGLLALVAGAGPGAGLGPGAEAELAPPLITWTFGVLALAAGLGALALAIWSALGDGRAARRGEAADEAPDARPAPPPAGPLDDPGVEPDARRAIIRCYASFERAAADAGLARKPWLTPMEFMREALGRLAIPRSATAALTGLFELARFSHHALGPGERDRALGALREIRTSIETENGDAGHA